MKRGARVPISTDSISVVLADDHVVLRSGLRLLINQFPDMRVVGEAGDFTQVVSVVQERQPNVLIMDISMANGEAFSVMRKIREIFPETKILVLSMHEDAAYLRKSLDAGASGFICKKVADVELISAVRAVYDGRTFVDLALEPIGDNLFDTWDVLKGSNRTQGLVDGLSPREKEVFVLIVKGHTNQQVADLLQVSVKSVETYRSRVMEKLNVKSRSDLVEYALQQGFL